MVQIPSVISIVNVVCILIVIFYVNRMLRSASIYNWNPGDSEVQDRQKIKILQSIVIIAFVGIVAAIANILLA